MIKNKKAITITLPKKTIEQLNNLKEKKQINKSIIIQLAIEEYIKKEREE